jgi:hypothetical protein
MTSRLPACPSTLYPSDRDIQHASQHERDLESDIAASLAYRPLEPDLVHPRHNEREAQDARGHRGGPRRKQARRRPRGWVVRGAGAAAEDEVFDEDDGGEGCGPIADDA